MRARLSEAAVLTAMSLAAVGEYMLAHTPIFNPPNATDPWFYTGAIWNLDFLYRYYGNAYYLSRLPWIIPGFLLNQEFSPQVSFLVEHVVFALAAAASGFLIARRIYGRVAAFAAFGALITSLLFYDAYQTDYPDGAQITFLLVALAFAVYAYTGSRARLKLAVAGLFAGAAVCTNLFDGLLLVGLALLYATLVWTSSRIDVPARLLDLAAFAGGVAVLVVACGSFAQAHGGRFLFFISSWHELMTINTGEARPVNNGWVASEPRLLIPLFLLALIAVTWRRAERQRDSRLRLAAGSFAYLALTSLVLAVWQFAGAGFFLNLAYYYRLFDVGFVLCTAAAVWLIASRASLRDEGSWLAAAVIALVAGAAPVVWIYGGNRYNHSYVERQGMLVVAVLMTMTVALAVALRSVGAERFRVAMAVTALVAGATPVAWIYIGYHDGYTHPAVLLAAALTTLTIALAVALRVNPTRARAALAFTVIALAVFCSSLAGAASSTTLYASGAKLPNGEPNPQAEGPAAMRLAREFLGFMKLHRLQETAPALWYNAQGGDSPVIGLASLYFLGDSYVAVDLPTIDAAFRRNVRQRAPHTLLMLCDGPDCAGAPGALRHAGYRARLQARARLHAGPLDVYLRAYTIAHRSG